jgi:hypothetical protein
MPRDDGHAGNGRRLPTGRFFSLGPVPEAPDVGDRRSRYLHKTCRLKYFIGVRGDIVTLADLPAPDTMRWVVRKKAEIVLAVHCGLLSFEEACLRYALTGEELASWENAFEQHGLTGLRSTHLQDSRRKVVRG